MLDKKTIDMIGWWIPLKKLRYFVRKSLSPTRETLKKKINSSKKLKIIVGAGDDSYKTFIPTEINLFDITKGDDWSFYFKENSIDNILAEHVVEHIDYEEMRKALFLAQRYLKSGGIFRIAVPDGYHPNKKYIDYIKPNGIGPGASDHRVLYNYDIVRNLFAGTNFELDFLEYYNENGEFISKKFSTNDGTVRRSKLFNKNDVELWNISLTFDAIKR